MRYLLLSLFLLPACFAQQLSFTNGDAHDFGKISDTEKVSQRIEFKNTGENILIISSVKTSCGCTATKLEKNEFAAGEAGFVDVSFNPRGKSGTTSKSVTFNTNDTETPKKIFRIKAQILTPFTVHGRFVWELKAGTYASETATVSIENNQTEVMTVTAATVNRDLKEHISLVSELPLAVEPYSRADLVMKIDPAYQTDKLRYDSTRLDLEWGDQKRFKHVTTQIRVDRTKPAPNKKSP